MARVIPLAALAFVTIVVTPLAGQVAPPADRPGRIVGRVYDAGSGDAIPGAHVAIEGFGVAGRSDLTGRYTLLAVPAGQHTVTVRVIGYAPKSVTGVEVGSNAAAALDIALTATAVEMTAVEVTAELERGSVTRALDEQRTSNQIMNTVTAEQIRRSPDSDAGQAVQRVSGVTVQDGKYVFVRGLGERYTTTSLNGARIPSPEPERKVVPLDLFPAGLLEGITTSKTFTPDQPGDFSGAQVNLRTREFLTGRVLRLSASAGMNDAAYGQIVPRAPTTGWEWLGLAGNARTLPPVAAAAGNLSGLSQAELTQIMLSFRNAWTGTPQNGTPNGSFSLSLGGEDPMLGTLLNYVGSLTYSYGQEVRRDERRALAQPGSVAGTFDEQNVYRGSTGRASVLWGGILNLSTRLGSAARVSLNNTVTHSGDNEAIRVAGFNNGFNEYLELTRLTFTERRVRSHQLRGEHLVAGRHGLEWSASLSAVHRSEPDRSDLAYQTTIDSVTGASRPYAWYGASRSATKTFSDVLEDGYEGAVNYRHVLGRPDRSVAIKVGGYYKLTERDADTRAFDMLNLGLSDVERRQPAEAIFNGTYAQAGKFFLAANAALGRYSARDRIAAAYAQLELALSARVRVIGGGRVERAHLDVNSTTFDLGDTTTVIRTTDVLPSLAVTFRLAQTHNLRLSASQTLSRPEYRELSPTPYFDVLGGQSLRGNPSLRRSLIQNLDARWEWYPTPGQVVSIALFAKRFQSPIERILIQRSDGNEPEATFVNATEAQNYGVEVELRRNLGIIASPLSPLTVFANATVMHSDITPGNDSLSSLTNATRPMVGQAGYVLNAGFNYTSAGGGLSATVLYNVAGRRVHEAAIFPLPDVYEEARHLLDLSLQIALVSGTALKLDAKNLLDAPYSLMQGPVERLYYRSGRVFSAGVSWQP